MDIMKEFTAWEDCHYSEIKKVHDIMGREISAEPEQLIKDLCEIEAWNARIGTFLSQANYYLDIAKFTKLPPKDYGTELDRRSKLDDEVSPIRCVRDSLESLSDAIRQRLIAEESILSYLKSYPDHKGPEEKPF